MSATFYFDLGSPFVYLAAERLEGLGITGVAWQPVSLGGLFKLTGRSSWGRSPSRDTGMAEIEARAERYGLPPLRWPDAWPGHYLNAMRACVAAAERDALEPFARTALRLAFTEGRDLSVVDEVLEAARRVGLDPEWLRARIAEPEIKERLRAVTQAALVRGVFGVPTLALGERMFWGDDQLERAAAAAAAK
jgi:2-hydroxychromene-2-carboxylate isomerase